MSIFDGKKKAVPEQNPEMVTLEEEITEKLTKAGILESIDNFIEEKIAQEPWITQCQSYYESCRRTVKIHEDLLSINWKEAKAVLTADGSRVTIFDKDNVAAFHYTDHGYMPLHSHYNELGNEDITLDQILYMWGIVVRERMMAKLPQCEFGPVYQSITEASFTYSVPAKQWTDWF